MKRTILYYPTIDIPTNSWLRHALLYWDEISSIVPQSYDNKILTHLSTDVLYLMDEGQFRPTKPEDLILKEDNSDAFESFIEEFKQTVLSNNFQQFIKRQHRSSHNRIHINKLDGSGTSPIHNNKTSSVILDFLIEQGLAKRDSSQYEWVYLEKCTALLYMSLLAKYLADIDSEQMTIGTDRVFYERFNFKRVNEKHGTPVISLSLDSVLPTPNPNVALDKIIKFKLSREQNLLHFKKTLSDFQVKIAKCKSQSELKEVAITFQESLINGVQDLSAVLNDARIDSKLKTFKSLISIKSPTTLLTVGAMINEKFDMFKLPVDLTAVGIATIGAIELTFNYIEQVNKQRAKERDSPFSYIYQAQKSGIITRY